MSIKDILHQAPWNRKRRLEYYYLKKAINKMLNDVKTYNETFKIRRSESIKNNLEDWKLIDWGDEDHKRVWGDVK